MMRIVPSLRWSLEGDPGEPLDDRLPDLLEAIAATASLTAAVAECGMSYRTAWGLLRDHHRKLGVALVLLERGRGASLTQAGERLLGARRAAARRLTRILASLTAEIGPRLSHERLASMLRLRMAASHDLALAALSEALPVESELRLDLSFVGSLHALSAFAAGDVQLAGFHVPIAGCDHLERKPFLQHLRARRDRLIRFVDREQGLIVPRGNPGHVKNFRDVAAKGLRFVNRQRGSGTRLLVDQMLADARIDSSDVNGYRIEEFTHAAVAATVASGGADAGFGLRAAAAQYELGFVPLVRERYLLVFRAKEARSEAIVRLIGMLRSPRFGRMVRPLAGYQTTGAGTILALDGVGGTATALRRPGDRGLHLPDSSPRSTATGDRA
jgi:putative molybdopterin biosynthesis protein